MTISVYGMAYGIVEYAQKSVDNLYANASEPYELNVVEGRSKRSPEFLEWGTQALAEGKIKRFIAASTNCRGAGLLWAMRHYPGDPNEKIMVCTDLDLLMPDGTDWIGLIRKAMQPDVTICGFTLGTTNYVSPNFGYNKDYPYFGNWLMGLHKETFQDYPQKAFQDCFALQHQLKSGRHHKIQVPLYHLGWDAWKDDPEYWNRKQIEFNADDYLVWQKVPEETVYEVHIQ